MQNKEFVAWPYTVIDKTPGELYYQGKATIIAISKPVETVLWRQSYQIHISISCGVVDNLPSDLSFNGQ